MPNVPRQEDEVEYYHRSQFEIAMKAFTLFLSAVGLQCCNAQTLENTISSARSEIASLIQSRDELAPKFLRLAFHDAVGGGNDGMYRNESDEFVVRLEM